MLDFTFNQFIFHTYDLIYGYDQNYSIIQITFDFHENFEAGHLRSPSVYVTL